MAALAQTHSELNGNIRHITMTCARGSREAAEGEGYGRDGGYLIQFGATAAGVRVKIYIRIILIMY